MSPELLFGIAVIVGCIVVIIHNTIKTYRAKRAPKQSAQEYLRDQKNNLK